MTDTIYAVATAAGRAGVAVVRLSGPRAHSVAERLCGGSIEQRRATLRTLRHPATHDPIDDALVLSFAKGASFTGEPVVEFQTHGSMAVVTALLDVLAAEKGCRLAEPGEFTRRALENGRMDLAQVEGLADLIEAETEAQRVQALNTMRGGLSSLAERWRQDLIRAMALLTATIDFADEEVPVDVSPEVNALLGTTSDALRRQLDGYGASERIREGFEVAIIGRPNAGKSTLINKLAGREAAIVSEYAGTTRDVIEVRMDVGGLPVTFLDTAGLRTTDDVVEAIGVDRARQRAATADMRIFLLEPGQMTPDADVAREATDIVVMGKADIHTAGDVSGETGAGLDKLLERISAVLSERVQGASALSRQRHRDVLRLAVSGLASAMNHVERGADWVDLASEDLRYTVQMLDSLVGRVDIEDVLDEVFASFCLGK